MDRKTPLYETHLKYGGKMVPFAGWILPVQYPTGVIAEHMAVRTACGMFDVSHMGEITCKGTDALKNLNHMMTNDFTSMIDGKARYSPMMNEQGGTVDDLIVYKMADNDYFIVVNAANKDKDFAWMKQHESGDCVFTDVSDAYAQIALQGPKAHDILLAVSDEVFLPTRYYSCVEKGQAAGIPCIISKTGYTGEDGYELYLAAADAPKMWEALMEAGKSYGLIPCGLGARDTLRLEAAMPLYGHEMNDEISPVEAGLDFAVKMNKEEFIGKAELISRGTPKAKRVGLIPTGRGILREEQEVYAGDEKVGETTSGTFCPYLKTAAAMAYVDLAHAADGTELDVLVRGKRIPAKVVPLPFYKRSR